VRNKSVKTRIKKIVKDVRSSAEDTSGADMPAKIRTVQSAIDKASKKGVIHKRTAARKISRLTNSGVRFQVSGYPVKSYSELETCTRVYTFMQDVLYINH
jgi:small subunit ribosomal protein S20